MAYQPVWVAALAAVAAVVFRPMSPESFRPGRFRYVVRLSRQGAGPTYAGDVFSVQHAFGHIEGAYRAYDEKVYRGPVPPFNAPLPFVRLVAAYTYLKDLYKDSFDKQVATNGRLKWAHAYLKQNENSWHVVRRHQF